MRIEFKWRAMAAVAAIALAVGGAPSHAWSQTLTDALAAAYDNNPTLLGERAGLRATDETVPQALADWRPTVEVTGSVGSEYNRNTRSTGADRRQNRSPSDIGISVTQPLYRGGRTVAATAEAENNVRADRARLIATEQTILLSAATAYLNLFRDEAVLSLNTNNERVLNRQLEATRDRFEVGEITRTDVHQAEARLARATADRIQALADLEASRANYENVVGQPAGESLALPELPLDLPESRGAAIQLAATQNPDVIAAEFDRRAAQDNVREARGSLLPEVDVTASATKARQNTGETGFNDTAEVTLNVTIPIYQQGSVYSEVREAKQLVAEQVHAIDQSRRDAVEDATRAWENLQTARSRVQSLQTQIEANTVALDGVEREAAVGSRTVLDVLDAEQELLDSRVNFARAQRDEGVAAYELLEAVGRMTALDLKLPVGLYDPGDHYREVRDKWFGTGTGDQVQPASQ